ncbi:hypothetical protein BC937DRAFT_94338, partial [Endogone sp. FLAS-F59071]
MSLFHFPPTQSPHTMRIKLTFLPPLPSRKCWYKTRSVRFAELAEQIANKYNLGVEWPGGVRLEMEGYGFDPRDQLGDFLKEGDKVNVLAEDEDVDEKETEEDQDEDEHVPAKQKANLGLSSRFKKPSLLKQGRFPRSREPAHAQRYSSSSPKSDLEESSSEEEEHSPQDERRRITMKMKKRRTRTKTKTGRTEDGRMGEDGGGWKEEEGKDERK